MKPWYKIVTPREDLREGKPLDASEFAVHLDQVREGRAPADYQKPERFFEQTCFPAPTPGFVPVIRRKSAGLTAHSRARDARGFGYCAGCAF